MYNDNAFKSNYPASTKLRKYNVSVLKKSTKPFTNQNFSFSMYIL